MNTKAETYKHILTVQKYLNKIIIELIERGNKHDASKLESPEAEVFEEHTPKLAALKYGSPEYKESLKALGPALEHHYAKNSHHPEHYPNGIQGVSLLDLIEMFVDGRAATERQNNGNIKMSIQQNQDRFKYSDDLKQIFMNTVAVLDK